MQNTQHFLITRFNVRVNFSSARTGLNPDWLRHRFELFDKFCYPSVKAQTSQNFQWLVYCDADTPAEYKQRLQAYANWKNLIPVYLHTEYTDSLNRQIIARYLEPGTEYLITTRIDNDDAISQKFIEIIQANFARQRSEFLTFIHGYVWANHKLYAYQYPNNPFISLIEAIDPTQPIGFKTVLCGEHSQLPTLGTIRQLRGRPAWLQVVHGHNVSNRIRGIRQPLRRLDRDFVLHPGLTATETEWLDYWLERCYTLGKFPLESLLTHLPPGLKLRLKALWT